MKVFISYSSKNRLRALRLAEALRDINVDVWWDEWDILVGHSFLDSIYDGLRSCDYLAVILTKHSVKSKYVKEELDFAKQMELENSKVKILPLLYEKCQIPDSLKRKHYADFTNFKKGFSELIKILGISSLKVEKFKKLPTFDDFQINKLFNEIDSPSHEIALKAASILSEFRDPKAKKLLLGKLKGGANERQIAIIGLKNYETDDVLIPISLAIPVDFLIFESFENRDDISEIASSTIREFFHSFLNFKTDLGILYLWGIFLISIDLGPSLANGLKKIAYQESVNCLKCFESRFIASKLITLFGYQNSKTMLEKLLILCKKKEVTLLKEIYQLLPHERSRPLSIPQAPNVFFKFKSAVIFEDEIISFEIQEYEIFKKCYNKYYDRAKEVAENEAKFLGALFMAAKEIYGFFSDDSELNDNNRLLQKLEIFYQIYNEESEKLNENEINEILIDKHPEKRQIQGEASSLFEYMKTLFPRFALDFMMQNIENENIAKNN